MTTGQRLGLLETAVKELHRLIDRGAKYGPSVSSEALYRMWQAEREDNIRLRILMQEREREHEGFKERVESGLQLLYDRAAEVSARLSGMGQELLRPDEQRVLDKFSSELRRGLDGQRAH